MPTICTFRGIFIRMYYDDHSPPHFQALCQGQEVKVAIDTGEIIGGQLTSRALRLLLTWAAARRPELRENWDRAQRHARLADIAPLE